MVRRVLHLIREVAGQSTGAGAEEEEYKCAACAADFASLSAVLAILLRLPHVLMMPQLSGGATLRRMLLVLCALPSA